MAARAYVAWPARVCFRAGRFAGRPARITRLVTPLAHGDQLVNVQFDVPPLAANDYKILLPVIQVDGRLSALTALDSDPSGAAAVPAPTT